MWPGAALLVLGLGPMAHRPMARITVRIFLRPTSKPCATSTKPKRRVCRARAHRHPNDGQRMLAQFLLVRRRGLAVGVLPREVQQRTLATQGEARMLAIKRINALVTVQRPSLSAKKSRSTLSLPISA